MRVAVVGSRNAGMENYELLLQKVPKNCTEIVSGGAEGIDSLAERYAAENRLMLKIFPPDYAKFGRNAPTMRNEAIIKYADLVIALWDGKSRGTANTVKRCLEFDTPVEVYPIKGTELDNFGVDSEKLQ